MELVVGRVAKSHGIRGEVAVEIRTDAPEDRFAVGTVLRARRARGSATSDYTVEAAREHSGRLLLRLSGVADRAAADALRGTLFVVDSETLPPSDDPDAFYDHELTGLAARSPGGDPLGTVADVVHTAAGELLAVRTGPDSREVLVPFVAEIVPVVDTDGGTVTIDPPAGLFDPDAAG